MVAGGSLDCPVLFTSPNGTASRFPTGSGAGSGQRSAAVFLIRRRVGRRGAMLMPMPIFPRLASNEANLLHGSCRDRQPKSIQSMPCLVRAIGRRRG